MPRRPYGTRLSLSIPLSQLAQIRRLAAEVGAPVTVVTRTLIEYGLQNKNAVFPVECDSCRGVIDEEVQNCPNCGNPL